ncbi:MAG: Lrp/AsnC family transcriptional regulator [Pseudomonadota bacterium]
MKTKDREIVNLLQKDGSLSMEQLAEQVSLSKTAVWRRVKNLQAAGLLVKQVALVDRKLAGFGITAFALVRTNQHSDGWYNKLKSAVESLPEILEFHRTSGDVDYVLRIVARDMEDYDRVYRALIRQCDFADISSTFVMETIKETAALPL